MEHIERRGKNIHLPQSSREAMLKFHSHVQCSQGVTTKALSVDESGEDLSSPPKTKRRRCHLCPSQKSKMQKQCCSKCYKNVCNEHSTFIRECSACKK